LLRQVLAVVVMPVVASTQAPLPPTLLVLGAVEALLGVEEKATVVVVVG
jgi:hypothetical protein